MFSRAKNHAEGTKHIGELPKRDRGLSHFGEMCNWDDGSPSDFVRRSGVSGGKGVNPRAERLALRLMVYWVTTGWNLVSLSSVT